MRVILHKIWGTNIIHRIILISLIVMVTFIIFMAYNIYTVSTSPQFDSCVEISKHIQGLTSRECVNYVNEHPYATGQEIVDHFYVLDPPKKSLEELLANTMVP